jgi:Tfp pilus assembly protein PilX
MTPDGNARGGERGIALVMALLVLMVVSIIGALLMATLQSETKMTSHDLRQAAALNLAEAGIGEAIARIRDDRFPDSPMNPRQVAQVFLTNPGSVPVLGADSIGLATAQPAGEWLPYTSAGRGPNALTIEWRTNAARDSVVRYDTTKDPPENLLTGWPIYRITATGIKGNDQRKVVTEVIRKPINVVIKGALAAEKSIDFIGNAVVCGYNHSGDTPSTIQAAGKRVGELGRGVVPDCQPYETVGGNLPSAWTSGNVLNGGAASQYSPNAPNPWLDAQTGFYTGPWDAFSMSQAEYWSWVGPNVTSAPNPPMGIVHLDNNLTRMDQSGSFAYHSTTGEGLLYVDGDLTLNAGFVFTGLVYIEGDLLLNGQTWILGALIVRGKTELKMTGGATILYSSEAIQRVLAKYGGQFVTLNWRETNR